MASWRDTYKPVNVAAERDDRGQTVDLTTNAAERLADQPSAPSRTSTAEPEAPTRASWRDTYKPAEPRQTAAVAPTGSWRDTYKPFPTFDPSKASAPVRPSGPDFSFINEFEEGTMTKEIAISDERISNAMRAGIDFRFGNRGMITDLGTKAAGGASGSFTKDMDNEEVYEMWQNWMRSFAGGQTVTTANEIAFLSTLDEEEKGLIGAQYEMFDKNPNIFSSKVGWGERFDGMKDYASAAIWDPLTLFSLGVGKALGAGATKTAGVVVRQTAQASFRAALKKGVGREAAVVASKAASKQAFIRVGLVDAAKYSAVDFVANVVTDVAYQNARIDTGAQEEFALSQTVMAGMATMLLPAIVGSSRAFSAWSNSADAPAAFKAARSINEEFKGMSKPDVLSAQKARIKYPQVDEGMGKLLKDFGKNPSDFTDWSKAVGEARKELGDGLVATDKEQMFMRSFLFGSAPTKEGETATKGLVSVMSDAGLVFVEREDTNITNFIGDAINFLPENSTVVADFIKTFTKEFGSVNKTIDVMKTPAELSSYWKARQSKGAGMLWDSKQSGAMIARGLDETSTNSDLAKAAAREVGEKGKKQREAGKYGLSLYKSLLTSHWSTMMLNVQGWGATQAAGTASDVVQGAIELLTAPVVRIAKGEDAYKAAVQAGRGSISGAMRRGVNFLQPGDTIEKALDYMAYRPTIAKELSKDLGGDSGAAAGVDTLKMFGMNPKDKLNLKLESGREFFQKVSGQALQDETTKMLSWMSNVDLMIRREYGMDYNAFMNDPKFGFLEMQTPRYRNVVEANALDRTMREVFSKNYTTKKGSSLALSAARYMESISSDSVGGYLIPFGKFFNNSMAMMSDYSGVNAVRVLGGKYLLGKQSTSIAAEETSQLIAKATVGITAAYMMSDIKMEGLKEGLKWSQKREDDGSITDETYKFPESMLHLVGQVIAHWRQDGSVPPELAAELVDFTVGQTFRSSSDAVKVAGDLARSLASGELDSAGKQAVDIAFGSLARIASGATRPLDIPNQGIKLVTGDWVEPDRNTTGDKWTDFSMTKKASRYFDEFFEIVGLGADDSPRAAKPTSPYQQAPNVGRAIGDSQTPGNTTAESAMNSVGIPSWQAFNWGNDPELKNHMNRLVAPIFEAEANAMIERHPDFFEKPLYNRRILVKDMIKKSKERAESWMRTQGAEFSYRDRLAKVNKTDLKLAMEDIGVTGNPLNLLKSPQGLEQLSSLLGLAENYVERGAARM